MPKADANRDQRPMLAHDSLTSRTSFPAARRILSSQILLNKGADPFCGMVGGLREVKLLLCRGRATSKYCPSSINVFLPITS